jgi:adenosylcobyric acid synthase
VETTLSAEKRLEKVEGVSFDEVPLAGYEMHIGVTEGPGRARPLAKLADGSPEGAVTADGRVVGTYIHGLFADDRQRAAWLKRFSAGTPSIAYDALVDETLDRLATHLEAHINVERLLTLAR